MDIFTAFGLSVSAGLNAYIPLLIVAFAAKYTDWITLDSPWDVITNWWVIGVLLVLVLVEFFADKFPAVNHINDIIQSFIRPTAGAIVFAASAGFADVHPALAMVAGVLIAGGVHATKSVAVRPAVTAATGGVGNTPVSILEDIISTALSVLAIVVPILIALFFFVFLLFIAWWFWRRSNRETLV